MQPVNHLTNYPPSMGGHVDPNETARQRRVAVEMALRGATVMAVVGPREWTSRPLAKFAARFGMSMAATALMVASVGLVGQAITGTVALAGLAASTTVEAGATHTQVVGQGLVDLLPRSATLDSLVDTQGRLWREQVADTRVGAPATSTDSLTKILGSLERDKTPLDAIPQVLLDAKLPFLALAARVETFKNVPYWDPGGLNVGYGYCITQRVSEYGTKRVQKDLTEAGFDVPTVETLLSGKRAAQKNLEVTPVQALQLLSITQSDYTAIARDTLSDGVFDALPANRQAALTWLAYNTGAEGFSQFKKLATAIADDSPLDAVKHLTPYYSENGVSVPNARAGTLLMAAYWSNDGIQAAVGNTATLLEEARHGVSPLRAVDPHLKAARGTSLPGSPYLTASAQTMVSTTPSVVAWRTARANAAPVAQPVARSAHTRLR